MKEIEPSMDNNDWSALRFSGYEDLNLSSREIIPVNILMVSFKVKVRRRSCPAALPTPVELKTPLEELMYGTKKRRKIEADETKKKQEIAKLEQFSQVWIEGGIKILT